MYPEYKAGRKPAPADFYEQIPLLHRLLEAFGWPLYELDDYEADDIMGTLAVAAAKKDIESMLVTSDMDMLQLVDPHVHVFALKKGLSNIELYSPKTFEAKYGIQPTQFLDLKSLKGDSSDNIPGVPGIGEKTALDLLKKYETLDGVYENTGLMPDKLRQSSKFQLLKHLMDSIRLAIFNRHCLEVQREWCVGPDRTNLFAQISQVFTCFEFLA
jgi:DNA polymerase-1